MTTSFLLLHLLILAHYVQCSWQNLPQYKRQQINRSRAARSVQLNNLPSPLLARLYAAKRTVLQTANSIDSMITEAIQRERFHHVYAPYKVPVTLTFPYIESEVVGSPKSAAAAIGVHGGKWYSGTLGGSAGQVSAGMVNTGTRRNHAYYINSDSHGNDISSRTSYGLPFQKVDAVASNYMRRPVTALKVPSNSERVSEQASANNFIWSSKAKPTAVGASKDPVEDMASLGDPKAFDNRCTVLKLTFEHFKKGQVLDDSLQKNTVRLSDGVKVTDQNIMSGHTALIGESGKIVLARDFKGKPKKAVGISMWVKLNDVKGNYSLFRAIDGSKNVTRYDLGVHDGKGSWVHYDNSGKELFRVESESSDIRPGKWHNIVANYNSLLKKASLWVDGRRVSKTSGMSGPLSQKWSKVVLFRGKTAGLLDNVFMFRCPLDKTKIIALYVAAATPPEVDKKSLIQSHPDLKNE